MIEIKTEKELRAMAIIICAAVETELGLPIPFPYDALATVIARKAVELIFNIPQTEMSEGCDEEIDRLHTILAGRRQL